MKKITYIINRWKKKRKICIYHNDNIYSFYDRTNQVYKYTVNWFEELFPNENKSKDFANKKDAINFAIEHYRLGMPIPFIAKSEVDRSYFKKEIEVEYVKEKHGQSKKKSD